MKKYFFCLLVFTMVSNYAQAVTCTDKTFSEGSLQVNVNTDGSGTSWMTIKLNRKLVYKLKVIEIDQFDTEDNYLSEITPTSASEHMFLRVFKNSAIKSWLQAESFEDTNSPRSTNLTCTN